MTPTMRIQLSRSYVLSTPCHRFYIDKLPGLRLRLRVTTKLLTNLPNKPPPSLVSLRSSVLEYQQENGRAYHSMSSGSKYTLFLVHDN